MCGDVLRGQGAADCLTTGVTLLEGQERGPALRCR
jgi:hypothetical protein